ncbi:hypothetical protein BMF94_3499 [Rhodotorula taiwanensis]|uniref:protein-tyrosine-phosphatase n=1 Tax=Rhodotorula taiwanensis TaxID=741276 RepID=A0A2S5BA08_9BASI|nr:hypothetical protein BMF94_3499 [Rhodotorula taiwanensis]
MPAVLFVCLGNICRSPLAEAVFADIVNKRGLDIKVDSAGTAGYHVGEEPETRRPDRFDLQAACGPSTLKRAAAPSDAVDVRRLIRGPGAEVRLYSLRLHHRHGLDGDDFSLLHADVASTDNMHNIEKAKPANSTAKSKSGSWLYGRAIALFGSFGDGKVIDDPYYGGPNGFDKTYEQCVRYSEGLLQDMGYGSDGGKL